MKNTSVFALLTYLLLSFPISWAQDVELSYRIESVTEELHQMEIFARSTDDENVELKAVNYSVLFDLSCIHPTSNSHLFSDVWTPYLENVKQTVGLNLASYDANLATRWQFGSADPGLPTTTTVILPTQKEDALPIMRISFEGSCVNSLYLERQNQNTFNQFADQDMHLLTYTVVGNPDEGQVMAPFAFVNTAAEAKSNEQTLISWETVNEFNGDRFEIEKSTDAAFSEYQVVFQKQASNQGDLNATYHFLETAEMIPHAYYRLKYVDIDGSEVRSSIMHVNRSLAPQLQLQASAFPNPTTDFVELQVMGQSATKINLVLSDLTGKQLLKKAVSLDLTGQAIVKLDLRAYAAAVYVLDVQDATYQDRSESIRIIKK